MQISQAHECILMLLGESLMLLTDFLHFAR